MSDPTNEQRIRALIDEGYSPTTAIRHVTRGEDLPSVPDGARGIDAIRGDMQARASAMIDANVPEPDSSLRAIVDGVYAEIDANGTRPDNVVRRMVENPQLLNDIEAQLGPNRRFGFVGRGDHALAVSFTDDAGNRQILRITDQAPPDLRPSRIVLTPQGEAVVDGIRLQVTEPVVSLTEMLEYNGGPLKDAEAARVIEDTDARLWREGNYSVDGHHGNYGMTRDGRVVMPDLEAARSIDAQRAAMGRGEMLDLRAVESQMGRVADRAARLPELPAGAAETPRIQTDLLDGFASPGYDGPERRAPDSPMRGAAPDADVPARNDGKFYDNFGREITIDPRTGTPNDPVATSRSQYETQLAENQDFHSRASDRARFGEYGSWDGVNPADGRAPAGAMPEPAAPDAPTRPLGTTTRDRVSMLAGQPQDTPGGREFDRYFEQRMARERGPAISAQPAPELPPRRVPMAANDPEIGLLRTAPELPVSPLAELEAPRGRFMTGGRIAGVAGVVLTAGMPVVEGLMDQRTDYGETRGEAIGRAYRHAPENFVRSVAAPVGSLVEGDVTMAAAQTTQLLTMVDVPGWVNLMRTDAVARGIPQGDVDRFMAALPPGNMNLGSRDPALNEIAQLIAYRNQGTTELLVGTNLFSAGVKIYGEGQQGMPLAEGTWVTRTDELLDEKIRQYMANGGNAVGIMEAINPEFHREQVYNRLRNTVPDINSPGYTEFPLEAREGRDQLDRFRSGIHAGVDRTPEGRAQMIELANEYLRVKDFDETAALRNANYQYSRLSFTVPRPEQLVAAGMGGIFNITGRPEDLRSDMENLTRVLNTPVGNDQTILSRINPGSDFSASVNDVYAALPPAMQQQVNAARPAPAAAATVAPAAPAAAATETPAPPQEDIVVTAASPQTRLENAREISRALGRQLRQAGMSMESLDENRDGKVSRGELAMEVSIASGQTVSYDDIKNGLSQGQIRDLRADRGIA